MTFNLWSQCMILISFLFLFFTQYGSWGKWVPICHDFNYPHQGGCVFTCLGLCVCSPVRWITQTLLRDFYKTWQEDRHGEWNNWLDFGIHSDSRSRNFSKDFFNIARNFVLTVVKKNISPCNTSIKFKEQKIGNC